MPAATPTRGIEVALRAALNVLLYPARAHGAEVGTDWLTQTLSLRLTGAAPLMRALSAKSASVRTVLAEMPVPLPFHCQPRPH